MPIPARNRDLPVKEAGATQVCSFRQLAVAGLDGRPSRQFPLQPGRNL